MPTAILKKNAYFDSITLMRVSEQIRKISGVKKVQIVMGTTHNKLLLRDSGLWSTELDAAAPSDLCITFIADSEDVEKILLAKVEECLYRNKNSGKKNGAEAQPQTISEAVEKNPDLNLALISVPGEYAAREARLALEQGLNVMMFSDNVSLQDELNLKKIAREKNLLMMGPDCGTSIINGIGLGFSNQVRSGKVGIVGASGTGIQEVSVLLDRLGLGISQAIGTGGRDLKKEIGALTTKQGLRLLASDPQTEIIAIISKPPHKEVVEEILRQAELIKKPIVLCFLGLKEDLKIKNSHIFCAGNLTEAVKKIAEIAGISSDIFSAPALPASSTGGKIYGLFCGGTLCAEAQHIIGSQHLCIDFGDDEYTKGRPHPMIDPTIRNQAFVKFSNEEKTAIILFDVVLGYGSHADPAGNLLPIIEEINRRRKIIFIASVCGSEADPQCYSSQVEKLKSAGVIIAPTNAIAAQMASLS
jgi:FdrA protein